MTNKRSEKIVKVLSNSLVKGLLAAILFHMVYSFIFGMLIGDKNPLLFLYKDGLKIYYMILMPILAAIPYVLSGYLITLARNRYTGLKSKNVELFVASTGFILFIYIVSFIFQYFFPYRNMYGVYIFLNYPASSYLIAMAQADFAQNMLVILSAITPGFFVYVGGLIRIRFISKEDKNG